MEASNHIRTLLNEIRLVPVDGILSIELVGELAGIVALSNTAPQTTNARSNYATGSSFVMVAGVCNQLNLLFSTQQAIRPKQSFYNDYQMLIP
jgi:hypothetical protein